MRINDPTVAMLRMQLFSSCIVAATNLDAVRTSPSPDEIMRFAKGLYEQASIHAEVTVLEGLTDPPLDHVVDSQSKEVTPSGEENHDLDGNSGA